MVVPYAGTWIEIYGDDLRRPVLSDRIVTDTLWM